MFAKKLLLLLSVFFFLTLSGFGQEKNNAPNPATVGYCELIEQPEMHDGKIINVFGEHRAGFEHSQLGSQDCPEKYGAVYVDWEKFEMRGDEKSMQILRNRGKAVENNYLAGNFIGKFLVKHGASSFGHMNAKHYKIEILRVENLKLLPAENSGCTRVDETSPFHYLEYVKTERGVVPNYKLDSEKKKTAQLVRFRLINNSSCSIFVQVVSKQAEKLENNADALVFYALTGTLITRRATYIFKDPNKFVAQATPVSSVLSPGNSINFAVPLRNFTKDKNIRNIIVAFKYVDKQTEENYNPFYFDSRNLPPELFKK